MKHKHEKLIAIWNDDNSTKFEFAYGIGVDFVWAECDITYVIKNPSIQIRVKNAKPKKENRWIGFNGKFLTTTRATYSTGVECEEALNKVGEIYENHPWQFIEVEVEI